jgi:hypothetical protein
MKIKVKTYYQENGQWKVGMRDTDLWLHIRGSWFCYKQMWRMRFDSLLRRFNLID